MFVILTLAKILALIRNFLPWVEREIRGFVNSLSCNLTVILIVEGKDTTQ